MTKHQEILIQRANESRRALTAAGFEEVGSVMAGRDSKSVWIHPDGRRAEIRVALANAIIYN